MSRGRRPIAIMAVLLLLFPCLTGAVWYKENLAYGMRDAILLFLSFAPSDSAALYLATTDGYVFSSHNQGLGWDEARIIVKGKSFFGAIRPTIAPSGAPVCAKDVLGGARHAPGASFDVGDMLLFDYGELNDEFDPFEAAPHQKKYDTSKLPGQPSPGSVEIRDTLATHHGGGGHAHLGVGLKTGAPRLKGTLRSMRVPSVGANLQQVLVEMGVEPTWINHIAVHPQDSYRAIAATSMGTFRTIDGGVGWLPIFAGTNRWERDGQHVRFDPLNPDRVYLGTQAGLFISPNGGDRWERVSGTLLESAYVKWLEPYVHEDGAVWIYAGTTIGAFLSKDSGQTWRWTYYETLPASNFVSSVAIDQQDPTHVILSSRDGLWVTFNGGASWETAGGLMFTATYVPRVLIDPTNGNHAFACTERNVWETSDGGRTWQVIYIDNSDWNIRNMELDPHEPGTLWIVTSGQILRLRNYRKTIPRNSRMETFKEAMKAEPSETLALETAMDNFHISPGEQARYRSRVAWSALVPEVRAVGGYMSASGRAFLDFVPLTNIPGFEDSHVIGRQRSSAIAYGGVMFFWDLTGVIFEFDQLNVGRVWGESIGAMYNLKFEMARYYNERIRLLYKLIVEPPEAQMAHLDAALRYQELTEHLDALTGGLYQDQIEQIKQGGATWLQGLY